MTIISFFFCYYYFFNSKKLESQEGIEEIIKIKELEKIVNVDDDEENVNE